jgi:predicted Zn-dependent peptidase
MKHKNLLSKRAFLSFIVIFIITAASSFVYTQSAAPREEKLLNGLKLIMFDAPSGDKVTLKVRIHAGSAFDPQGKEGLMKLLAANVFPNPEAKEYFADKLGGSLDVVSNYDYIQINASSKPENLVSMIETVAGAIVNMENDKEVTAKLKASQLKRTADLGADPAYVADQAAAARLLGTFPYGRPEDGTAGSISKIDFADLSDAKHRFFTADNATVAVAGNFDESLAFKAVRRYFGAWLKADKLVPSTFRQPDDPPTGVQMIDFPVADRSEVRFITRGTSRSSNDFAAYEIAAKIIENKLRAAGQASVSVDSVEHTLPGVFVIRFSGAKAGSNDAVAKALNAALTDAEFQSAKQTVLADLNKEEPADRWLDADTFRSETPTKFYSRAANTSLADVQNVMSRLQKQPTASVVVSGAKTSN